MEDRQNTMTALGIALAVVSTIVVLVRGVVRLHIHGLGLDDYLMAVGMSFYLATIGIILWGVHNGIGAHDIHVKDPVVAKHALVTFETVYMTASFFIKTSICCAVYRIATQKWIHHALMVVVGLCFCQAFVTVVAILNICHPVAANWTGKGSCSPRAQQITVDVGYYISVMSVCTDFACSALPCIVLWRVQMRPRVKAAVIVVLSLSFSASAATIVRASYLKSWEKQTNFFYGIGTLMIWSMVEGFIAAVFGSLPALAPLVRAMKLFGTDNDTITTTKATRPTTDIPMRSMKTVHADTASAESILGPDRDADAILRKDEFTVVTTKAERASPV